MQKFRILIKSSKLHHKIHLYDAIFYLRERFLLSAYIFQAMNLLEYFNLPD